MALHSSLPQYVLGKNDAAQNALDTKLDELEAFVVDHATAASSEDRDGGVALGEARRIVECIDDIRHKVRHTAAFLDAIQTAIVVEPVDIDATKPDTDEPPPPAAAKAAPAKAAPAKGAGAKGGADGASEEGVLSESVKAHVAAQTSVLVNVATNYYNNKGTREVTRPVKIMASLPDMSKRLEDEALKALDLQATYHSSALKRLRNQLARLSNSMAR